MPRTKTVHRLKPLSGGFRFAAKEHKTERLLEILRGIAIRNQAEESQQFYPVRDVADRYQVSLSVVSTAYHRLEGEGLLSTARGSKTLLQGTSAGRRLNVLGFIGVPAAVSSFVALQDYRTFFIRVRRELRARGYAAAMVLFDRSDIKTDRLYKRIAKHNFDSVVWYQPDASARDIISRLRDSGVRVIGVNDHHISPIHNRYEIRREAAITDVLHYWRTKAGISSVEIVRGVKAAAKEETLQRLLEEEGIRFEFRNAGNKDTGRLLRSLGHAKSRGIIFPSWVASQFSFRAPEGLMDLAERCYIAFTGGPPTLPFTQVRDVCAELIMVDWQLVAEKIVGDLTSKSAFERGELTVFPAKAHIRVLLSHYSQVI